MFGFEVAHASQLLSQHGKGGVQVSYGAALPESVFHVEWTIEYEDGAPLITHHTVKPSSREVVQLVGPALAPLTIVWEPALGGRPRFAIETPQDPTGAFRERVRGNCKVWLDVDGHDTYRLPATFVPWGFVMASDKTEFRRDPPRESVEY